MYINFKLVKELNLQLNSVLVLFSANQNRINDESTILEEFKELVRDLFDLGLLDNVKRKNKAENLYSLIRISAKGKKILEDITTPEVTLGDCEMRDFLCKMYLDNPDEERKIGNKKAIGIYCSILRNYLGLTLHEFYYLCDYFLMEHKFTKLLEYIFFNKNKHRYSKFQDVIEDSPLYQFWEQNEKEIREYFKQKIKE
jgi:hypothetical protein